MYLADADDATRASADRIRRFTAEHVNRVIDRNTERNAARVAVRGVAIRRRIAELGREWDIERVLESNAATLAMSGLLLCRICHFIPE